MTGVLRVGDARVAELMGGAERAVVARVSKGTGLPGRVPDVLGLAVRVVDREGRPWDFTFATAATVPFLRWVPVPVRGWDAAHYGSLMPYRFEGGPVTWLYAQPVGEQPHSAGVEDFVAGLAEHPAEFTLLERPSSGPGRILGKLTLIEPATGDVPDYVDPVLNHPAEVELLPEALAKVREWAYAGSREGRGGGKVDALPPARL
ncbi:phosphodiesterase [Nocardia yunnanensis]|uniref:phosphodiesterase n=1 Tax=Nocardia yunnanensis TaxID=2382165 RepID=UPI0013C4110F|nr:phosphodiesterase [Nocardia yunnanensis]